MIGSIAAQSGSMVGRQADVTQSDRGNRDQTVGHKAKAAVAAARDAGVELPKNAQGLAASGIAGGVDPSSLFVAFVGPVEDAQAPALPAADPSITEPSVPADDPVESSELAQADTMEIEASSIISASANVDDGEVGASARLASALAAIEILVPDGSGDATDILS